MIAGMNVGVVARIMVRAALDALKQYNVEPGIHVLTAWMVAAKSLAQAAQVTLPPALAYAFTISEATEEEAVQLVREAFRGIVPFFELGQNPLFPALKPLRGPDPLICKEPVTDAPIFTSYGNHQLSSTLANGHRK